jgi:hypothetical protein
MSQKYSFFLIIVVFIFLCGCFSSNNRQSKTYPSIGQYAKVPNSEKFNLAKFEIEAYVKPSKDISSMPPGYQTIVKKEYQYILRYSTHYDKSGHSLQGIIFSKARTTSLSVNEPNDEWKADKWYHVSLIYDGNDLVLMMDGKEIGRKKQISLIDNSTLDLIIGNSEYGDEGFIGAIDEVKVWSLEGASKKLVAYYPFEEEAGSTKIKDESGNGLDGVLVKANRTPSGFSGSALVFWG